MSFAWSNFDFYLASVTAVMHAKNVVLYSVITAPDCQSAALLYSFDCTGRKAFLYWNNSQVMCHWQVKSNIRFWGAINNDLISLSHITSQSGFHAQNTEIITDYVTLTRIIHANTEVNIHTICHDNTNRKPTYQTTNHYKLLIFIIIWVFTLIIIYLWIIG